MPGGTFYALFSLLADQSPLNALRALGLTTTQLWKLTILLRAMNYPELATLVSAEADLRTMLEEKNLTVRWLN